MSAALPVAVLPARVATRVTFAMAAPLCVVWTLVPGSAPAPALLAYWAIAVALGVGAFGPVRERVSAAIVTAMRGKAEGWQVAIVVLFGFTLYGVAR